MTTAFAGSGAVVGLVFGLGLALLLVRLPALRRPSLQQRLEPYLRDAASSRLLGVEVLRAGPLGVVERLLGPVTADVVRWLERISGGPGTVLRRLEQLGPRARTTSVEQFRAEQVLCGVAGAGAGAVLGLVVAAARGLSVLPVVGMVLVGGVGGVLARDWWLTRQVRRREQQMLAEFPAVAELLALSVGAGEGAVGALDRVAHTCRGELADELARTLAEIRTGTPLVPALERLAARTSLPALARFVDGVAVAVERGTPLGDVLRAQAQDVRELSRRRLMESGGKREIAMTVPVVFLVLPITVLFAVYPGLAVLDLSL